MSALRAVADLDAEEPTRSRPSLTVIEGGSRRRRFRVACAPLRARSSIPFALLCAAILVGSLVGVLLVNTRMVNGSYDLSRLQREAARAAQDVQMLHEQVRSAQANLPKAAAEIGMVPAEQPTPLDVSGVVVLTAEELQAVAKLGTWPTEADAAAPSSAPDVVADAPSLDAPIETEAGQ